MVSPPLKPEVCIVGDRLAVFMGADYKLMELAAADKWVRKLQGELAKLKRQDKRHKRQIVPRCHSPVNLVQSHEAPEVITHGMD